MNVLMNNTLGKNYFELNKIEQPLVHKKIPNTF